MPGSARAARLLAEQSFALFSAAWARRLCPENYNATTGEPLDQPDTDGFYGWGALMPAMAVGEVMDVSPWSGWEVTNTGADVELGPIESPAGAVTVAVSGGVLSIRAGDRPILETDIVGTLTGLRVCPGRLSFTIAAGTDADATLRLPGVAGPLLAARAGGRDLAVAAEAGGLRLTGFRGLAAGTAVDVVWSEA